MPGWLRKNWTACSSLRARINSRTGISTGSGYVLVTQTAAHIPVDFRYYSDIASRAAGYEMHLLNTENRLRRR